MNNPPQAGAVRLTFEHEADTVRLTRARPVDMKPVPSDALEGYAGHSGFWLEVRDASGKTIYRRVLPNPTPTYHEVHNPNGRSTHVPVQNRRGAFEVVIPAPPAGAVVAIFATPQPPAAPVRDFATEKARAASPRIGTAPAQEIARFSLEGAAQ